MVEMVEKNEQDCEAEQVTARNTDNREIIVDDDDRQFLTFRVADREYGVNIMIVREIRGWTEATRLPNSEKSILGVINLRGMIIPIYDLRSRFAIGDTEATEKHVIVVVSIQDRTVGILVDSVSDILTIHEPQLKQVPDNHHDVERKYISGLISENDRMVMILDTDEIFSVSKRSAAS